MNDIIINELEAPEINELLKLVRIYFILKLIFLFIITIALIAICFILNNISTEISHFMHHAFDCCHYLF